MSQLTDFIGVPKGIRTPVTAVKGRCPGPLDDGDGAEPNSDGGARRDRTADLLHAMQALSQLSYGPTQSRRKLRTRPGVVKPPRPLKRRVKTPQRTVTAEQRQRRIDRRGTRRTRDRDTDRLSHLTQTGTEF